MIYFRGLDKIFWIRIWIHNKMSDACSFVVVELRYRLSRVWIKLTLTSEFYFFIKKQAQPNLNDQESYKDTIFSTSIKLISKEFSLMCLLTSKFFLESRNSHFVYTVYANEHTFLFCGDVSHLAFYTKLHMPWVIIILFSKIGHVASVCMWSSQNSWLGLLNFLSTHF